MGDRALLITGATGFLGGLVVAEALARTDAKLVLPLRDPSASESVLSRVAAELAAQRRSADASRMIFAELPTAERMGDLLPTLRDHGVTDVLHCAGCLSYFNVKKLEEGNLALTRALTELAADLGARRFVFLSTAYSAGFVDAGTTIAETLHDAPGTDPTDYTRTKREAEMIVAGSGVPFVIARPSIVVGHSEDGRYGGKPYGIYQLWTAFERFLAAAYPPVLHIVAADVPVNFLHQDSFISGFWAAYSELPDGSVVHLVSRNEALPSMRELCHHWLEQNGGPNEVHFYGRLDEVPPGEVDEQLQLWLEFTAVNSEIASVNWPFEHGHLDDLRTRGLPFEDASLASLAISERRFIADSPRVTKFIHEYRERGSSKTRIVDH